MWRICDFIAELVTLFSSVCCENLVVSSLSLDYPLLFFLLALHAFNSCRHILKLALVDILAPTFLVELTEGRSDGELLIVLAWVAMWITHRSFARFEMTWKTLHTPRRAVYRVFQRWPADSAQTWLLRVVILLLANRPRSSFLLSQRQGKTFFRFAAVWLGGALVQDRGLFDCVLSEFSSTTPARGVRRRVCRTAVPQGATCRQAGCPFLGNLCRVFQRWPSDWTQQWPVRVVILLLATRPRSSFHCRNARTRSSFVCRSVAWRSVRAARRATVSILRIAQSLDVVPLFRGSEQLHPSFERGEVDRCLSCRWRRHVSR